MKNAASPRPPKGGTKFKAPLGVWGKNNNKVSFQKIVFIGSGNVATFLSEALNGKREIVEVYSKTLANARKLGQKLGCNYTDDLKKISKDANLYIIAVKDDAIEDVCNKLKLPGKIVVHTSGSVSMEVLKQVSNKCGVIWPLYSFAGKTGNGLKPSRTKPFPTEQIPFFIEASDKKTEKELTALVKEIKGPKVSLWDKPYYINSEKRAVVHLAAVFVNNFPNHLFTIAETLCKEAGVPFSLFLPIAQETVENLISMSPALSQTGPAARNDERILKKHLALLSEKTPLGKLHPMYREIYEILTKSIIQTSSSGRKKL